MTYGTNHGPSDPMTPSTLEDFVAREHWDAIGRSILFQAAMLATVAALMAVPPEAALAMVHLVGLVTAGIGVWLACAQAERGDREAAVTIGRRAMASLALSGLSLVTLIAMV